MDEQGGLEGITYERRITIQLPASEGQFIMRKADWFRIERNLSNIDEPIPWLQIVYSLFFGIAISTGLSWVLILNDVNLPPYVSPLYVCVVGFSVILGLVCLYLDSKLSSSRKKDIKKILDDMGEIEKVIPQFHNQDHTHG
jgi:hypothetical protein